MNITKHAASKDASDHLQRARRALDDAHRDGLNADDVLRNPHVQASHLRVAREEINKALAIIEQTRWQTDTGGRKRGALTRRPAELYAHARELRRNESERWLSEEDGLGEASPGGPGGFSPSASGGAFPPRLRGGGSERLYAVYG